MKDIIEAIQNAGGVTQIENPQNLIVDKAKAKVNGSKIYQLRKYRLEDEDKEKRPEVIPQPTTYNNLLKRLAFEKTVRQFREEYEDFTGQKVEINWKEVGTVT